MSAEQLQLEATITALESQRALLGDAVVEMAVAPLRAKLQALLAPPISAAAAAMPGPAAEAATAAAADAAPLQALKQVTILFLDVVGSTTLSQRLDPEEVHEVMDGALTRCTAHVEAFGGKVLQYAGDNLLAVFGGDEAREDDAERGVRSGLAMLEEGIKLGAEVLAAHGHAGFNVRVGLHTGGVLLGGGVDAEGSIRGLAVNVAARMEQTAPSGGLRISQHTFRHVRGLFEVEVQPPIAVKGVDEPIVTYLVSAARPRSFRATTRGIEGTESQMIGREAELQTLQSAFHRLHQKQRLAVITIVAEAGVGKSRLLHEFALWAERQDQPVVHFQGRAEPHTEGQPFGLLRDVLARWLQISDSDSMDVAKAKIEQGVAPLFIANDGAELAMAHSHLLGHLIGLDFSDSPHVQGIVEDPQQIRSHAFHTAAQLFRRVSATRAMPLVLQLDDLHWSDDGSLEFINYLAKVNRDVPMLCLGLTRHTLFERRSDWRNFQGLHRRIDLAPLDSQVSQALAHQLLGKLPNIPTELSDLLVRRAEGNPFYMEELVKMLLDQGALEAGPERWTLRPERLLATPIPSTLTGVLQARLDGLPAAERTALQQASVVGLVFWDQALAALDENAPLALPSLVQRVLALPSPDASLAGAHEYSFRHQILHEVTYDTVLKRTRRVLHARAANWLAGLIGARAGDFLGDIAEHYAKAGDSVNAGEYFTRAAEQAKKRYAHEATLQFVGRALDMLGAVGDNMQLELRWRALDTRERTLDLQGRRPEQRADLDVLDALAEQLDDNRRRADLATRRSLLAVRGGDYQAQEVAARRAMALAAEAGDDKLRLNAQRLVADALGRQGDVEAGRALALDGLAEARTRGLRGLESRYLNALTVIAARQNDLVAMIETSQQATTLRRELGDRRNEAIGLGSIGSGWLELGEFAKARQALEEGLSLHRAVGDRGLEPIILANLSQLALWQGDGAQARLQATEALALAEAAQAAEMQALALWSLGNAELALGQHAVADEVFARAQGVTRASNSALIHDATAGRARVALACGDLTQALSLADEILAHLAQGGTLDGTLGTRLIQLSCYQVLTATGDDRAAALLSAAHSDLMAKAATISDAKLRESFLAQVPENRAILTAASARQD